MQVSYESVKEDHNNLKDQYKQRLATDIKWIQDKKFCNLCDGQTFGSELHVTIEYPNAKLVKHRKDFMNLILTVWDSHQKVWRLNIYCDNNLVVDMDE